MAAVTGKPGPATQIFAIWNTSGPYVDAGLDTVVSVSPYFLPGGAFTEHASAFLARTPQRRLDKPFDMKRLLETVREQLDSPSG